mmetsp:Transcript_6534/g.7471  ORF Transcript_6534/g.7471 Transcript_6534/m.7471 type:complete len:248 (-) Transcript_6534:500-1243(-)|eukprot:CAMPEP_0184020866 /NCGR_PEP_ID=MMETSP0954-20121128/9592_1 /TAXON_ID=627963 /ORGANISM="Aplanochytrium sp, Strain PBS07" /LENGTH=247 /DNA_ID=CAMNT_0026302785 /DNA_START=178 /DNA_END=921 /DNA_ORIENTATION=+
MASDAEYVCPFCSEPVKAPVPPSCKMCGNSFRGLNLDKINQDETLTEGLLKVTQFTRQQQQEMKNRKNWYNEDLQTKKSETNVKWDDPFATNYQRENNMTVDESLDEIEEFTRLANAEEFDEEAWRRLAEKYNNKAGKHANNLPVNEMFMQKLQENRDKKNGKDGSGSSNSEEAKRMRQGASSASTTRMVGNSTNSSFNQKGSAPKKGNGMVPKDVAKKMLNTKNKGKGAAAFGDYVNKKQVQKKLW